MPDETTTTPTIQKKKGARIKTPRLVIDVTQDIIARAVKADSRTCMIAEAIKINHPEFVNIQVDIRGIRVTDPGKNLRYVYMMPFTAGNALLMFDQGAAVIPFKVRTVQAAQVVRHNSHPKNPLKPAGDREKGRAYKEARDQMMRDAQGAPTADGEIFTPPEYQHELAARIADPTANLGPATPMLEQNHNVRHHRPVIVGGKPPRPGQLKNSRRFGAREFWPGDGSGLAGLQQAAKVADDKASGDT